MGIVLEFFLRRPGRWFTPFEVHAAVAGPEHRADHKERWPLTSTRRSLSVLTARGQLRRCSFEERRDGEAGMKNYCWRLVEGGSD